MGGGHVDCYLDIASFFSYVALEDLLPNLDSLAAHGVKFEFHPVFLGGIMAKSGNQPPWMFKLRAQYLSHDSKRAASRVGITNHQSPPDFMERAKTLSVLRALHYVKANFSTLVFLSTLRHFYWAYWTPPNICLLEDKNVAATLAKVTERPDGGKRAFSDADIKRIMDGRAQMKDALSKATGEALELGAYGAPWFNVTNSKGQSEPFFGSDRFNHIYRHLDIPFQDVAVQAPGSKL